MEIIQHNTEKAGNFKALSDGKTAGLMTYTWAGKDKFIIDHTEVNDEFKGTGVGKKLVMEAVAFARKNSYNFV